MSGMEATKFCQVCERAALLLGHCRGHGHSKKWNWECHTGHVLRCGQRGLRGLRGTKHRYRGKYSMRG